MDEDKSDKSSEIKSTESNLSNRNNKCNRSPMIITSVDESSSCSNINLDEDHHDHHGELKTESTTATTTLNSNDNNKSSSTVTLTHSTPLSPSSNELSARRDVAKLTSSSPSTGHEVNRRSTEGNVVHHLKSKATTISVDGLCYTIVANPPETKVTKDAIESNRPTETIVARRGVQKTTVPSAISPWNAKDKDISSSIEDKIVTDTSSILKESTMETLPPVDTVEACDKAASRLRELAQHLDHGEVPISILKKTLQYAACVLDTVTMDETRKWRPGLVRKKGLGVRAPSDPTPSLLTKSLSICGPVPITNQSSSLSTTKPSLPSKTTTATTTIASSSLEMSSDLRSSSINKTIPTTQISRKILDEEDDLSEVQPDAVPNEVREWLASTFTRNNTAQKRRSEEKPKFRSVANAIRAGIMVDRLYRRLCCSNMVQIPPKIADKLKSIDNWSYDCFKLNEASNNQVLKYISYELLNRYGLVHKFKIPLETLESCLNQFEQGYTKFKNPYHNNIHAADVTQTVHYMLSKMGLVNWLTDLEIFATLLAAIIHDFQHTGTTNNFHVMSESETALLYNDRAVLENFHISAAFRILKENDCNILVNLNKEEYRELRTLVIDMVLATDMSSHFQQIKTMKSLLSNTNEFTVDKSKALSLVLHCCDISHPSKQWDIHRRWTELLLEEFFRQGDKERELGLPYSPLCDRNTTLVAESQIGFIDFIVAPSLEVCGDLLDKIYQQMEGCRHSSGSSEESLEERLPDNGTRPKSLSTYKNKRSGLSVDSADSQVNSRPVASAPASPRFSHCTSFGNCKAEGGRLKRPWFDNLEENRKRWQERATIDAIQREQNARKQPADGISLSMSPESEL
ncbi:dual specificity calcium/calmodulin-dependent 3',5'-cyclic nucleotide phosphodiesterase 1B-like isoform X1 [Panonychus citri]|uniref:dual specificity calcium/calmodulin-dependent 3',5'-cyclic nucleotide phosphodiesterase 1B-like isoform X1 n=1 Tax=Panonychus citri TaxID=50023 RepID=UPI0023071BBD|nr:dual specificity calcium/calmodulin-dependent 3',5'-cyclic nucleotide phosphodiesterase 1B-like isoform X1 [Panonychus citri]